MIDIDRIIGFDWDEGNLTKNEKHGVSLGEAEQVFLNQPLFILEDTQHSQQERRLHALGQTDEGRKLHIVFTLRGNNSKIRVISARDMHRKEKKIYAEKIKTTSSF